MSDDDGGPDWASAVFAYLLWKEMRDANIGCGEVAELGCRATLVVGALLGAVLLIGAVFDSCSRARYAAYDGGATATLAPTPPPTLEPTPEPTPTPTPSPSPTPAPKPVGTVDLRFSGDYAEHYVARIYAFPDDEWWARETGADPTLANQCTSETRLGQTLPVLTGFALQSSARSKLPWTLSLEYDPSWAILTVSLPDTGGIDPFWYGDLPYDSSVKRTKNGFTFNALLTNGTEEIRAKGTVTCR